MACGTPVLANATGGLTEIIEHGKDGWLVPLRDENALAAAMVSLSRQPLLRARLVKEGRKKVAARFSSDRYLTELQTFYLNVGNVALADQPSASAVRLRLELRQNRGIASEIRKSVR
jgi:glycosyltransferase involved in cell wall biosynthesis